jgi:hypothetical protein
LVGVLGRNQGPTKLDRCDIDNFVLANGLRGNSRLKSLRPCLSDNPDIGNRQVHAIASALRENKGLVDLDLGHGFRMSDETWGAVCDSLKTHPTLHVLNLHSDDFEDPAVLKSRVQALLDMMNINTSIHTIHLRHRYSQHEIFRESVIPYLETNRFRPHVRAIQKTSPIPYRAKVLGRALLSARTDVNRFWMLLSGNAEVALPSGTTTIAAVANLLTPMHTTAAATSPANVAAVSASLMSDLTTTATGCIPTGIAAAVVATSATTPSTAVASDTFAFGSTVAVTAAAIVATPSNDQKRKACP